MKLLKTIIAFSFIFSINHAKADQLDDMIGQMVLIGFHGKNTQSPSVKAAVKDIKAGKVGGLLFLGGNIGSKKDVIALTTTFQNASSDKLLMTIDQEGGRVRRLREKMGAPSLRSAKKMVAKGTEFAHQAYFDTALYIKSLGFNVNFGPVVDLAINPSNPVIAKLERSYGKNVQTVVDFGFYFADAHKQAGVLTALKHFPGHGSSTKDSHKGFVDVSKTWQPIELEPFRSLIENNQGDMIMAAHVFLKSMSDDGKVPTSLSKIAITDVLRGQLGFNGVVVSDDMAMGAITKNFTSKAAIIKAVNAGTDIVMVSFKKGIKTSLGSWVHGVIKQAVVNGQISKQTIIAANARIQSLKAKLP